MPVKVAIDTIRSNAGDEITLQSPGVTCLVGGNNVGKSQFLRDILAVFTSNPVNPITISAVNATRPTVDQDEALEWLKAKSVGILRQDGSGVTVYTPVLGGNQVELAQFHQFLNYSAGTNWPWMGPDASFFVVLTSAGAQSLIGSAIDTADADPGKRLSIHLQAAVAEHERAMISVRTREGMTQRAAEGWAPTAKNPEGRAAGRPRSLPEPVRARIARDRAAGMGLTAIANALNDGAVPTAQGGLKWYPATVAKVLASA